MREHRLKDAKGAGERVNSKKKGRREKGREIGRVGMLETLDGRKESMKKEKKGGTEVKRGSGKEEGQEGELGEDKAEGI